MSRSRWTLSLVPVFAALGAHAVEGCSDLVLTPLEPGAQGITTPGVVGDPCIPSNEKDGVFGGFGLLQAYVETGAFASCESGVCLIDHFQGRVSCPLGQAAPRRCFGPADGSCGLESCMVSETLDLTCDPQAADHGAGQCSGVGTCSAKLGRCVCASDADCPDEYRCDADDTTCKLHVCGTSGHCQVWNASAADNAGKACCSPDTGAPIAAAVCGQCSALSHRAAADAVHCSCRCGPPDNAPADYEADYCDCPDGFECSAVVTYVGLGDLDVAGKYCIKAGSAYQQSGAASCGEVKGYVADLGTCFGTAAPSP